MGDINKVGLNTTEAQTLSNKPVDSDGQKKLVNEAFDSAMQRASLAHKNEHANGQSEVSVKDVNFAETPTSPAGLMVLFEEHEPSITEELAARAQMPFSELHEVPAENMKSLPDQFDTALQHSQFTSHDEAKLNGLTHGLLTATPLDLESSAKIWRFTLNEPSLPVTQIALVNTSASGARGRWSVSVTTENPLGVQHLERLRTRLEGLDKGVTQVTNMNKNSYESP